MHVTLSNQKVVLKSLSRKAWRDLQNMRKDYIMLQTRAKKEEGDALQELRDFNADYKREEIILSIYTDLKNPDELTQRDVVLLCRATEDYTNGASEVEIKNLLMSGGQEATQTD